MSTTTLSGSATVTISGLTGYDKLVVLVAGAQNTLAGGSLRYTINGSSTAADYSQFGSKQGAETIYSRSQTVGAINLFQNVGNIFFGACGGASDTISGYVRFEGCTSSGIKSFIHAGSGTGFSAEVAQGYQTSGTYNPATVISSLEFFNSGGGNFTGGTIRIYGSN